MSRAGARVSGIGGRRARVRGAFGRTVFLRRSLSSAFGYGDTSDAGREALKKTLKHANYLGSRGAEGLPELKKLVAKTSVVEGKETFKLPDGWYRKIPLHGACMNAHVDTSLKYLVEELKVSVDAKDPESGDAAIHMAVTWGRPEVVAYLLGAGASYRLRDGDGLTPLAAAKRRQRLLDQGDAMYVARCAEKGMDIAQLREGGQALVAMLAAVEKAGSWTAYEKTRA